MSKEDFIKFLMQLCNEDSKEKKLELARNFHQEMKNKCNGQFYDNGLIDEFIEVLNKLKED